MPALVTPMLEDGSVDYPALEGLIEFHIEQKTDAIVSVGTTGQSATLSHKENVEVVEFTVKAVNGRIPVIAGTGSNSTTEAIEMTLGAKRVGADAALLVVPYYNKPPQEGLFQHFTAIADAVAIPQILYNVPGRTVADMAHETTVRLSTHPHIIGIKDATADIPRGKALVESTPDDFFVWSGEDASTLELLKVGGKGTISVTANIAPRAMHDMCAAALAGDMATAEQINATLDPLHRDLFIQSSPSPATFALSKMGLMQNHLRLPLVPLAAEHEAAVLAAMQAAGIAAA